MPSDAVEYPASVEHYLDDDAKQVAKSTSRNRQCQMNRYIQFLNDGSVNDPSRANKTQILGFFDDLGKTGLRLGTLRKYQSMLVAYHEFLQSHEQYDDPVVHPKAIRRIRCGSFVLKGLGKHREPLSIDEMTELLGAATNRRDELLVYAMYLLGLRKQEVRNLRICDLDFEDLTAYLDGKQDRVVPFTETFSEEIQDFIETERETIFGADEHDFLFPSKTGGKLSGAQVTRIVLDMAERAGIQRTISVPSNSDLFGSDGREIHAVTSYTIRYSVANHMMTDVPNHVLTRFLGLHSHPDLRVTRPSVDEMFDLIRSAIEDIISGIDR